MHDKFFPDSFKKTALILFLCKKHLPKNSSFRFIAKPILLIILKELSRSIVSVNLVLSDPAEINSRFTGFEMDEDDDEEN